MPSPTKNAASQSAIESYPLRAIFLVSLAVPLYFLLLGYFGDDYSFHLSSWIGIVEDWRSGVLLPAWYASTNYGLGEPRFYFYPPLSLFCGGLLWLIFPTRTVPALMPWLAVVVSGLSMLKLARHLIPGRATQAALLYCTSFYLVFTIVMRYAIAEVFVAAILPLIILYAIRLLTADRLRISVPFTVLLAFAWLTNIPAAIVVFYILLFGSVFLAILRRNPRPLLNYLFTQVFAIGLSAWYLIPAALAKVQLTTVSLASKFPWRDYTLFHHPQNPLVRSLTYPLWLWAIAGFVFILSVAIRRHRGAEPANKAQAAWYFITALGCTPLLFELPQSGLLWNHLPALKLVAFSFRFLPFVATALSLLIPQIRTTNLRRIAYTLWIVWMLMPIAERIGRYRVHGAPEAFPAVVETFKRGTTSGMSEYLPAGIDKAPASEEAAAPQDPAACATTTLRWTPQTRQVESHSQQPCFYEPGLFYFPEWHITVDTQPVTFQRTPAGHLQIQLPAGEHHIEVFFQRPRQPLVLGTGITLFTILLLLAASRRLQTI